MRHNNTNRKQILKCVMLSSYLILISTFHPRSPEREQEIEYTEPVIKVELNSTSNSDSSIFFQENFLTQSENLIFDNLEPRFTIPFVSLNENIIQSEAEEEVELAEETSEPFEIPMPTDFSFLSSINDCTEIMIEDLESAQQLKEESELEVAIAYECQPVEEELIEEELIEELIEEEIIEEITTEDPELVAVLEYTEEDVEVVQEVNEELELLAKQPQEQPVERIYHPVDWEGGILTAHKGVNRGPSGKETYYNLPMDGIVNMMHNLGYEGEHWIREDGVHMFGEYVMVAANLSVHPRGSIVETSLGMGRVCDTGGFARKNPTQLDIATNW